MTKKTYFYVTNFDLYFTGEGVVASTSMEDGALEALGSSSDPEHSSLSDVHREENGSDEEESVNPVTPNLFLKRSVDEDFANNNDQRRRLARELEEDEQMDTEDGSKKNDDDDLDDKDEVKAFPAALLGLPTGLPPGGPGGLGLPNITARYGFFKVYALDYIVV